MAAPCRAFIRCRSLVTSRLGLCRSVASRPMNGFAYLLVCSAAAEVASHGLIDFRIGRIRFSRKQSGGGHDLTGLAVAALRHVELDPSPLDGMGHLRRQALDCRYILSGNC